MHFGERQPRPGLTHAQDEINDSLTEYDGPGYGISFRKAALVRPYRQSNPKATRMNPRGGHGLGLLKPEKASELGHIVC